MPKKTKKNKTSADRKQYQREYYEKNKQKRKEKNLANRESRLKKMSEYNKQYHENNRASRLEAMKQFDNKNRESRIVQREQKRARIESTRVSFTNFESHHHIEMSPGDGVDRHFEGHQNCPEANTTLNHITTGRNHFTDDPKNPKGREKLKQKIRGQEIYPDKQKELAEKFLLSQGRGCEWASDNGKKMFVDGKSRDALILGCACCGFRSKDSKNEYVKEPLSELSMLKLNEEEKEEHVERIKNLNFYLPSDNAGTLKLFNLWKVWSIWPQKSQMNAVAVMMILSMKLTTTSCTLSLWRSQCRTTMLTMAANEYTIHIMLGCVQCVKKISRKETFLPCQSKLELIMDPITELDLNH